MDEARAVVADFCEKNPYLLGALPMTWFGCGPFARIEVDTTIQHEGAMNFDLYTGRRRPGPSTPCSLSGTAPRSS